MCAFAARERRSEGDDMQRHRAQKHSIKLFVVFKYATNKLFVSGVILISPSFPSGFPPP